ncbi:MAG: cyclic nucleotide-binding domain-containing protein [Actinomycetota bacterium]
MEIGELRGVPALADAAEASLEGLAAAARVLELGPSTTLFEQGDPAEAVDLVLEGRLVVEHADHAGVTRRLAELGAGEVVGEIAAMTGAPRSATVRVLETSRVVRVPVAAFTTLLELEPAVGRELAAQGHRRLRDIQLAEQLTALFPGLPEEGLADIRAAVKWVELPAGEVLFTEGEAADAGYVLVNGRLAAERGVGHGPVTVGEVSPGELVGEQALIEGGERSATVHAIRDAELARISQPSWSILLSRHPSALAAIARIAITRARQPVGPIAKVEATVALIAADDGVDLTSFARRLTAAMDDHTSVFHVSREVVEATLAKEGIADSSEGTPQDQRLGRWLAEVEDQHEVLVLETDPTPTAWTRRAVRMAEHIVVVADATASPSPHGVEAWLDEPDVIPDRPRRSLVLLQPAGTSVPTGTDAWLAPRTVVRHHHVRMGRDGDLARIARHLAGTAVGLALSGGGARGFGHVGVVRALRENDIPIDVIAGASMGTAVAAVIAMDHASYDELHAAVADTFHKLLDYTLPMAGLIRGKRIADAAERCLGERGVEDLPIPLLGVSTDLTSSRVAVHRRGDARRVIRASVAIPGVLPPLVIDDALHVDGGVLDNLPMGVVREEVRSGTVVAVDVSPTSGPRPRSDFGTSVSGWSQLGGRLLPWRRPQPVPGLATTALGSQIAASNRSRDEALEAGVADLYLHLGRLPCGLLEFDARERVIEAGYAAAADRVAAFAAQRAVG